jgi:uncharacterized DUF497 family protein
VWLDVRWDPIKELVNLSKHGISFMEAKTATQDPLAVVHEDLEHAAVEQRYLLIGSSTGGRLLVLVVAEVDTDTARIISARRPTRRERHDYENTKR